MAGHCIVGTNSLEAMPQKLASLTTEIATQKKEKTFSSELSNQWWLNDHDGVCFTVRWFISVSALDGLRPILPVRRCDVL